VSSATATGNPSFSSMIFPAKPPFVEEFPLPPFDEEMILEIQALADLLCVFQVFGGKKNWSPSRG